MMRVSKMTVYRMVHSGELPAIRFGRSFRVPESAVAAVAARTASPTSADAPSSTISDRPGRLIRGIFPRFCSGPGRPIQSNQ